MASPPGVQGRQATSTLAHHHLHIQVLLHIYILFRTSLGPMLQARGRVEVEGQTGTAGASQSLS